MSFQKIIIVLISLCAFFLASSAKAQGLKLIRDQEIENTLSLISKPVFVQAGLLTKNIDFILIENDSLNAFVAGGQNIFLHTGLILKTENVEELIGVIAHETGHISGGHLFRVRAETGNLTLQAMLANMLGMAVAIGAGSAEAGMAIGSAGSHLALRSLLRHTRTQEGAADQAGIRFLKGADLPLTGFLSFMKKLSSQELLPESQQSQYLLTHPLTQDRVQSLEYAVKNDAARISPAVFQELHARIKSKLLGYLFPDRALLDRSDSLTAQYARAIAWFRKGELEKSLSLIEDLLKKESKNPYFYELKGQVLFENGFIEKSIFAYQKAVNLAPEANLIRLAYAHSLLEANENKKERIKEVVQQMTKVLSQKKRMSEPHHLLAIAYGKQGNEGLSRLHLAEEALMKNKVSFAKREASIAKENLKKGTPAWMRAQDILHFIKENEGK